jgi:hypothetical protein
VLDLQARYGLSRCFETSPSNSMRVIENLTTDLSRISGSFVIAQQHRSNATQYGRTFRHKSKRSQRLGVDQQRMRHQ